MDVSKNQPVTVAYDGLTIESIESDDQIEAVDGVDCSSAGWEALYVPIVDAAAETVVGAEVQSSTNCLTSLPIQIWRRVLLNALMGSVLWRQRDRSLPGLSITMPVGLRHLASPLFDRSVRAAVAGSGVNPALVVLSLSDDTLVHANADRLRALADISRSNIRLRIEGPNAYSHLARNRDTVAFDQIQIPMHDAGGDPSVHRMVARAHGLDLEVVASRVSTEQDLREARRFGARCVMGPQFSSDERLTAGFAGATPIA